MIVFVTAMLLLNITPGPDMLYVIRGGRASAARRGGTAARRADRL